MVYIVAEAEPCSRSRSENKPFIKPPSNIDKVKLVTLVFSKMGIVSQCETLYAPRQGCIQVYKPLLFRGT